MKVPRLAIASIRRRILMVTLAATGLALLWTDGRVVPWSSAESQRWAQIARQALTSPDTALPLRRVVVYSTGGTALLVQEFDIAPNVLLNDDRHPARLVARLASLNSRQAPPAEKIVNGHPQVPLLEMWLNELAQIPEAERPADWSSDPAQLADLVRQGRQLRQEQIATTSAAQWKSQPPVEEWLVKHDSFTGGRFVAWSGHTALLVDVDKSRFVSWGAVRHQVARIVSKSLSGYPGTSGWFGWPKLPRRNPITRWSQPAHWTSAIGSLAVPAGLLPAELVALSVVPPASIVGPTELHLLPDCFPWKSFRRIYAERTDLGLAFPDPVYSGHHSAPSGREMAGMLAITLFDRQEHPAEYQQVYEQLQTLRDRSLLRPAELSTPTQKLPVLRRASLNGKQPQNLRVRWFYSDRDRIIFARTEMVSTELAPLYELYVGDIMRKLLTLI